MNQPIKTALIGFGTGGQFFHAPFLYHLDEFDFVSIVERTKGKAGSLYPSVPTVRSAEEIWNNKELELVVITTPNDTHYPLAKAALEAGKHVLLDKPFVVTSAEAADLIAIAKNKRKLITVYHNRRFHSDFFTLQKLLKDNTLGEIQEFMACFDRYRPELRPDAWKESGRAGAGIFYDLGSHLIDQVLVLFGKPIAIQADLQIQRAGAGAVDYFDVKMHYPNFVATLKAGMLVEKPGPIFWVKGTNGTYTKEGLDQQEAYLRAGVAPTAPYWAAEKEEFYGQMQKEGKRTKINPIYADYTQFYKNLYGAIREDVPLAVKPEEAAEVIRCIELAIKSSVENKALVSC